VTFPDSQTTWTSIGAIRPIAIEIVRGVAFLAADIHSRELCTRYENPPGSVVVFRWIDRKWLPVAISEYPQSGRVNLLLNPWGRTNAEDAAGFIELKDKRTRPGNDFVHVPLDQRMRDKAQDACAIYKTL
jgi:hypothetical protein